MFLIGVIISSIFFMSFVWEMKLEKKRKENEILELTNFRENNIDISSSFKIQKDLF